MASASLSSPPYAGAPTFAPTAPTRRAASIRKWDRAASLFLVASILLAVVFGLNRLYPGNTDTPPPTDDTFGFIPMPTIDPDTGLSAYPLVTAEDCTQEPMSREELIAYLTAANTATDEWWTMELYERSVTVSAEDEAAVTAVIREWQACNLRGKGPVYSMRLQTPWMTGTFERSVSQSDSPVSAWTIEQRADQLFNDPELDINATPVPPSTPATPGSEPDAVHKDPPTTFVPIPDGSTPVVYPERRGRAFPSMIEGDMQMVGPDRIVAPLYWIDENTKEVHLISPYSVQFIRVDGVWLINLYGEPNRG